MDKPRWPSMHYRVYLLDQADRVQAAETFMAFEDAEALEMGAALFRATRDVFAAHEVWCGPPDEQCLQQTTCRKGVAY